MVSARAAACVTLVAGAAGVAVFEATKSDLWPARVLLAAPLTVGAIFAAAPKAALTIPAAAAAGVVLLAVGADAACLGDVSLARAAARVGQVSAAALAASAVEQLSRQPPRRMVPPLRTTAWAFWASGAVAVVAVDSALLPAVAAAAPPPLGVLALVWLHAASACWAATLWARVYRPHDGVPLNGLVGTPCPDWAGAYRLLATVATAPCGVFAAMLAAPGPPAINAAIAGIGSAVASAVAVIVVVRGGRRTPPPPSPVNGLCRTLIALDGGDLQTNTVRE